MLYQKSLVTSFMADLHLKACIIMVTFILILNELNFFTEWIRANPVGTDEETTGDC